jgi:hypothetical protein
MIIMGTLVFSIIVFVSSYRIGRSETAERGKLAAYIALLMWVSFLWGLFIMWNAR